MAMFWFDPKGDRVVFIICDLGMGIATSYTNEKLDSTTQFVLEQNQVVEALTSGNSRYRKPGRVMARRTSRGQSLWQKQGTKN